MLKKKRKQYTTEFKAKVVKEMLKEEKTVGQLAAEYEVHSNMLYRWRDQALAGLPSLFSDQATLELAEKEAEWESLVCRDWTLNHTDDVVGKWPSNIALTRFIRRIPIMATGASRHNCTVKVSRSIKKR